MAKFFGFEINRKSLSAAFASVLGAFAVSTAAAQEQAPAADGAAPEVIAKGNIIKKIGELGPAVLVYSDRSVKFEGGGEVPAGDHAFIGRHVDKEALFNSGLGTYTMRMARNQLLGSGTAEVGPDGVIVSIKADPDMAHFADLLAKPPSHTKPVATIVKHHGPKAGKPVAVSAKAPAEPPVNKAVLGAEGNRVKSETPVADATANNLSAQGAASALESGKPADALPAGAVQHAEAIRSELKQGTPTKVADASELLMLVGLVGSAGLAALIRRAKGVAAGTQRLTSSRRGEGAGDEYAAKQELLKVDVDGDNPNLPQYSTVADAFGQSPRVWVDERDSGLLAGDGGQPAIEGQCERITQVPITAAPVGTKDTGYNGEDAWPPSIPNLTEVAQLTAAITNACNKVGALASGIGTEFVPVESHDKGRHAEISPRVGGFYCDLSKGRFKLTVLPNEDGTLSIKASGEGLGRGKAPVEATLGADGKLVIDQKTLAARMSAKQTKGNDINAEFAKAAFETFGAKAETVIMRALNRAVAVIQAAPEAVAVVPRSHHVPAANAATRTLQV